MASKKHTFPEAIRSRLTNRNHGKRDRERTQSSTSTSHRIHSFPVTPPQRASITSLLDHVATIPFNAISLVDKDVDDLKDTYSGNLGEGRSQYRR